MPDFEQREFSFEFCSWWILSRPARATNAGNPGHQEKGSNGGPPALRVEASGAQAAFRLGFYGFSGVTGNPCGVWLI